MAILQVGKNGKAPGNAKVGDTIRTAGGDYKITGGSSGNWQSQKVTGGSSSSSSSRSGGSSSNRGGSSSGYSGNVVNVGSDGKAPKGLSQGTIVKTAGGDYHIDSVNSDGTYKSSKYAGGNISNGKAQISGNTQSTGNGQRRPATITSIDGKTRNGYVENGHTFDDAGKPIAMGEISEFDGKKYKSTVDGGMDMAKAYRAKLYDKDENGDIKESGVGHIYNNQTYDAQGNKLPMGKVVQDQGGNYWEMTQEGGVPWEPTPQQQIVDEEIMAKEPVDIQELFLDALGQAGLVNSPDLGRTLTLEEAMAQARNNLSPTYEQAMSDTMSQLDDKALRTGFYGQLPTEALKRETAGKLEAEKLNSINDLAQKLFGQSQDTAYKALDAATAEQQNKIKTLLNMLGIANDFNQYQDSRKDTDWEKAMEEKKYNLSASRASSGGSGGSSGGSGGSKSSSGGLTQDEAFKRDSVSVMNGSINPENIKQNMAKLVEAYGVDKYKKLLKLAEENYKTKTTNQGMATNWWER